MSFTSFYSVGLKCRHLMLIILLVTSQLISLPSQAQYGDDEHSFRNPRQQLAGIIFAGLGGAVLGLSTLSFYSRPQDKLSNIAVGFGAGIIIGTIVVTFKSAASLRRPSYSYFKSDFDNSISSEGWGDSPHQTSTSSLTTAQTNSLYPSFVGIYPRIVDYTQMKTDGWTLSMQWDF